MWDFNYLFITLLFQPIFLIYGQENITEPFVEIQQGKLKSKISEDYNGIEYFSFQGIPYAKPPIDELRFKAPVPAEPWADIFDATKEGNDCLQYEPLEKRVLGSEDCLKLNVYTPEMTTDLYFVRGIFVTTRVLLNTTDQPIYLYRFNIQTALNLFKNLGNITTPGVCHADDIGYLFKGELTPKIESNSTEDIGFKRVVKLWTNFAKTGNPTSEDTDSLISIKWPQLNSDDIQSLDIDQSLKVSKNPEEERMRFWAELAATNEINAPF